MDLRAPVCMPCLPYQQKLLQITQQIFARLAPPARLGTHPTLTWEVVNRPFCPDFGLEIRQQPRTVTARLSVIMQRIDQPSYGRVHSGFGIDSMIGRIGGTARTCAISLARLPPADQFETSQPLPSSPNPRPDLTTSQSLTSPGCAHVCICVTELRLRLPRHVRSASSSRYELWYV